MNVLFLAPYPIGEAPSQRFRFEQYFPSFSQKDIHYQFQSFWTKAGWEKLYVKGNYLAKTFHLLLGFWRRLGILFRASKFDFIFIHRELTPIGPPVFEYVLARILKKKIIYDFDDAIWLPNTSEANKIIRALKFHHKVAYICEMSWKVSVGNESLKKYAAKFNDKVIINPTVVDTENYHSEIKVHRAKKKPVIGWTGTHSTSRYLKIIDPFLVDLRKEIGFDWVIVSNEPVKLKFQEAKFIEWEKEEEIDQLRQFDIGVMPLEDSIWEKGKCGFKIIQYLSLGIPAVASPVGINQKIIDDGENGYLPSDEAGWKEALRKLLQYPNLRNEMGKSGREKIVDHFSVLANLNRFLSTFA